MSLGVAVTILAIYWAAVMVVFCCGLLGDNCEEE